MTTDASEFDEIVRVRGLRFTHPSRGSRRSTEATLDNIELSIAARSSLGIVGESGSGKSTLIRVLCGLLRGAEGSIMFHGTSLEDWLQDQPNEFRRLNQMVYQSPYSSLDPRMRIRRSVAEPVRALERRRPTETELQSWLTQVGLDNEMLNRYPHQLSGGQLQRVAIARAISINPAILYADEPTSALDVSIQAQVLGLLTELRTRLGLTLVIVSHDLAVVARMCENVVVLKDGVVVEAGPTANVLAAPQADHTKALIAAARAVSLA